MTKYEQILEEWNKILRIGIPSLSVEDEDNEFKCIDCGKIWVDYIDTLWCRFGNKYDVAMDNNIGRYTTCLNFWNDKLD